MIQPFHLAIPVKDLETTRSFYGKILGLQEGRSSDNWIDWDFFGHQLSTHVKVDEVSIVKANIVDGKNIPVRHFGVVLDWQDWHDLSKRLEKFVVEKKISFIVEPYIRFKGEVGEQATMFFLDYSHNALEFKSFKDMSNLFKK
jgi:extradiol dioxygenase family protein